MIFHVFAKRFLFVLMIGGDLRFAQTRVRNITAVGKQKRVYSMYGREGRELR